MFTKKFPRTKSIVNQVKSVWVMVCLHIFPVFSFLAKILSSNSRNDNIFARNENIGKICKRTTTWTDFRIIFLWSNYDVTKIFTNNKMATKPTCCDLSFILVFPGMVLKVSKFHSSCIKLWLCTVTPRPLCGMRQPQPW